MFEEIINCKQCGLCKNQSPLLDNKTACKIFWVGLSAKKISSDDERPLSPTTNSGSIIKCIEEKFQDVEMYKTNLVKCLPLDDTGKLRYPNKNEILHCLPNLKKEINELSPKILFLLGNKVINAVGTCYSIEFEKINGFNYKIVKYQDKYFVPIHHPSYVYVYKRKNLEDYEKAIETILSDILDMVE